MIRDLEALLLTVIDTESRAYMHEAIKCYNAGAYRAAVVLSMAAGMDGLRRRFSDVAQSTSASQQLKDANNQIEKQFENQKTYEAQLIDDSDNKTSLISPSEAKKLQQTLTIRHLCAHPSGHSGSAEEARDAIATVIDLILSRPALTGITGVTSIVERMSGHIFFPDETDEEKIKKVVTSEVECLNPSLYNELIARLVRRIRTLASSIENGQVLAGAEQERINIRIFLAYLPQYRFEDSQSVWKSCSQIIEDPNTTEDALFILSNNPDSLSHAASLLRERAIALIRRNLSNKYARKTANVMRERSLLVQVEIDEIIQAATTIFKDANTNFATSFEQVLELSWPEIESAFFDSEIDRCDNYKFDIANNAIIRLQNLSDDYASHISPAQQVRYILTVATKAGSSPPTYEAKAISDYGLKQRASFLNALKDALQDKSQMLAVETNWEYVARICKASGNEDIIPIIIGLFDPLHDMDAARNIIRMLD